MIHRIICCATLVPAVALAQEATPREAEPAPDQKTEGLWQPILPPTSAEGADALDRQVYSQFANDELHLAHEPGSGKSYAFVPHGAVVAYYDDNITLSPTNRAGDFAIAVEPGLAFGLGDFRASQFNYLTADYAGRGTAYWSHTAADAYEQFATVRGQLVLARWKFNTSFRFFDLDDVDIDSGERTSRSIYDTLQVASYELSEKNFLEAQAENIVRDYQVGPASVEWQGRGFYNYRLDPKVTLSGGLAGGVLNIEGASGQTYEQALLRLIYDPTVKISFVGQGGLEMRQLASGEDRPTVVLDFTWAYRPAAGTTIELTGYRRNLSSSAFGYEDYTASGVSLFVAQELGIRWKITLKAGYENNSYFFTEASTPSPRQDNFFYLNPAIQFRLTEHAKLEFFYNYRQDASDNTALAFTDNQTGIRASFTF